MNREQLKQQLIVDEGLRLKCYIDTAGKTTIGVGRNIYDVGISEDEAMMLLENDIDRVITGLNKEMPWWTTLSDEQQAVLANMCFNMGIQRLQGFVKMLAACQAGRFHTAADEMRNSRWADQVGDRAERLAKVMEG